MADLYTAASVDFNQVVGKLNHKLHASNSGPALGNRSLIQFDDEFKKMNFYSSRTHDWALWNQGQRMVDTHFVFPLYHLDPSDPKNYYFKPTDDIIKLVHNCNMHVFYRMGTSIEHSAKGVRSAENHYNTLVPEDPAKYAEILAGIVRHYTRGWADGFEYKDMVYWEIWNEPELGQMWAGDDEQFVELFVTVLKRLKSEFPELKVGGPAFAWVDIAFTQKILDRCKAENVAPDFISWHFYGHDVEALASQPAIMRKLLDDNGFTQTETCINEWHYLVSWDGVQASASYDMRMRATTGPCGLHGIDSGCFNLAVLSAWHDKPLDSAFYYGASLDSVWGFRDEFRKENKNSFSMKMMGRLLYEAEDRVKTENHQHSKTIYILAAKAKDCDGARMIVTDYRGASETIEIDVEGMENAKEVTATVMDAEYDAMPAKVIWNGKKLTLIKNTTGSSAFYVTFR
ncbi:MAG: hypothetical protein IKB16_07065 [Lentisphaeria bacterium]|nr:hypothetical protein [Lentisphaeria bacterium]